MTVPATAAGPQQAIGRGAGRRLGWVEFGRGLAALGVVLSHYNNALGAAALALPANLGGYSVEFFFTLSGFIIFHVHGREIGDPRAVPRYAWRRFARVLPTYWIMLACALVFNQTLQNPDARIALTGAELGRQALLLPNTDLLIGPGWTLRHELLFYTVFAIVLLSRRVGLALFAGWMVACLANLSLNGLPPGQIWTAPGIALHHYNLDFALGALIAASARRGRVVQAAIGSLLVAGVLGGASLLMPGEIASGVLAYKFLFAAILGALVALSVRGVPASSAGVALGAMSYALYISHITVGIVVFGGLKHAGLATAIGRIPHLLIGTASALAFAWLFFRRIEDPMLRRLYAVTWARPQPPRSPPGTIAADQAV